MCIPTWGNKFWWRKACGWHLKKTLAADTEWLMTESFSATCTVHMENCWGLVVVWLSKLSGKALMRFWTLGSILGNCQPFTFCFITSKAIYLHLKQDVLKIIMNTVLIQIVTTMNIPIEALTWFVFTAHLHTQYCTLSRCFWFCELMCNLVSCANEVIQDWSYIRVCNSNNAVNSQNNIKQS